MKQLASSLVYLQSQGIVHRDLKPDNLMVTTGPLVTIIDFNVAYDLKKESSDGRIKGSTGLKEWSAPETRSRLFYGTEAESWSLGCILYFMVFGFQPFTAEDNLKQ